MTDFINFLNAYPLWVRIAVVFMLMAVIVLLVFFKPSLNQVNVAADVSQDASHGLSEMEKRVLVFLATPNLPMEITPEYVAQILGTHEINVQNAARSLEQKRLVLFPLTKFTEGDVVVGEKWSLFIVEKGRQFLAEHNLLD